MEGAGCAEHSGCTFLGCGITRRRVGLGMDWGGCTLKNILVVLEEAVVVQGPGAFPSEPVANLHPGQQRCLWDGI